MTKGSEQLRQERIRQRLAAGEIRNLPAQGERARRPRSSINPNAGRTMGGSNRRVRNHGGDFEDNGEDFEDYTTQHFVGSNPGGTQQGTGELEDASLLRKRHFYSNFNLYSMLW